MSAKKKRREFITLVGGAVAWPIAARAQQSVMRVIGFLSANRSDAFPNYIAAFHEGLGRRGLCRG